MLSTEDPAHGISALLCQHPTGNAAPSSAPARESLQQQTWVMPLHLHRESCALEVPAGG